MTIPVDCISAYMVVDPTNLIPSLLSSLLRASDSGLVVIDSRDLTEDDNLGAKDQRISVRSKDFSRIIRALPTAADILALFLIMPVSDMSSSIFDSPKAATF